jgi:hypothetical protein
VLLCFAHVINTEMINIAYKSGSQNVRIKCRNWKNALARCFIITD